MVLSDKNGIGIYFEVIKQLEPQRILDIGMFLKRIGSVSRKVADQEIPESVKLDGIDFFPEVHFRVWDNIYNEIISADTFFQMQAIPAYDCVILFGMEACRMPLTLPELIQKIRPCTRYLFTDQALQASMEWNCKITNIKVLDTAYYLLDFGV